MDTSRDSGWSNGLIHIKPHKIYQTTNNRDFVNDSVLKNYDVLTICSNTQLKYTETELKLIHDFVEDGGGLLLAGSTSRFERDVRETSSEMGINDIASLFGTQFVHLPEGHGDLDSDANPLRGYIKKDITFTEHEITNGLKIDDLGITYCGILDNSSDGEVFLQHCATNEPIGICQQYGSGRVLMINTQLFHEDNHRISTQFLDWLGINRISLKKGTELIPDEIQIDEHLREEGNISIFYTDFVEDRVDSCMAFAKKLSDEMVGKFPLSKELKWTINLVPSCIHYYRSEDSLMTIGGCVETSRLAYSLGVETSELITHITPFSVVMDVMFDGYPFLFGIWGMKLLGFEKEAAAMHSHIEQRYQDNFETFDSIDISRIYDKRTLKHIWIMMKLVERYGEDLFVKLAVNRSETDMNMPRYTFSWIDSLIYFISRAVDEDLFPWFEEIGTTVNPIPLLPADSEEFIHEVRSNLNRIMRDSTNDISDRINAIISICEIADESERETQTLLAKLNHQDKYKQLIAAIELSRKLDDRGISSLEKLVNETEDDELKAIALLYLVKHICRSEYVNQLIDIVHLHDYKFQLETGYLLNKIAHPEAKRFTYESLRLENDEPVITIESLLDNDLHIYAMIEGYRIAMCHTTLFTNHFPEYTPVPGTYVRWVHTKPEYRRKGLARVLLNTTLSSEFVKRYSCITLRTSKRNTAHAMYRDLGFVDGYITPVFTKILHYETVKAVDGIVIRPYKIGDEVPMTNLCNTFYTNLLNSRPVPAKQHRISDTQLIYLVEMNGTLLGYVKVQCNEEAKIVFFREFCLIPNSDDNSTSASVSCEEIGVMLLCTLHNELIKRGYTQISWYLDGEEKIDYIRKLFAKSGYTLDDTDWVWMFKVINLPMLLEELSPLLENRLQTSNVFKDWQGTIGIKGTEHNAILKINSGMIQVSDNTISDTGLSISTDDDTLTGFILGVFTPYDAYLQNQLYIEPTVNSSVVGLLETLFPKK
ncbi:GNAT family N-acetyltransferase [Candidatus Poribacteria bacterium]|nr:GNAT family N-acetyltransferase [Candidatus Poribacteria bacterium]